MLKKNLIILFATACLFEISLRIYDPWGLDYFGYVFEYVDELVYNEGYGYLHKKNSRTKIGRIKIETNSYGMRWRELTEPKAKKRLLILGDSVVFGWSVKQDRIFPELIDIMRNDREVVSAGVGSWNTVDQYEWLKENYKSLALDELLLVITDNDIFSKKSIRDLGNDRIRSMKVFLVKNFKSFAFAYWTYKRVDSRNPTIEENYFSRKALLGIYRLCKDEDIKFKILLYGSEDDIKRKYALNMYSNVIFWRLNMRGKELQYLPDNLLIQENQISKIDRHLNAMGHWKLAKYILRDVL